MPSQLHGVCQFHIHPRKGLLTCLHNYMGYVGFIFIQGKVLSHAFTIYLGYVGFIFIQGKVLSHAFTITWGMSVSYSSKKRSSHMPLQLHGVCWFHIHPRKGSLACLNGTWGILGNTPSQLHEVCHFDMIEGKSTLHSFLFVWCVGFRSVILV